MLVRGSTRGVRLTSLFVCVYSMGEIMTSRMKFFCFFPTLVNLILSLKTVQCWDFYENVQLENSRFFERIAQVSSEYKDGEVSQCAEIIPL